MKKKKIVIIAIITVISAVVAVITAKTIDHMKN